jgi:superfamily II DNA or RNA helicase
MALYYPEILAFLERSGVSYRDEASDPIPVPPLVSRVALRPYQESALKAWLDAGRRGVVVLPTAAGKTYIALKAMERLRVSTLVVVPTLDLLDQWRRHISDAFGVDAGVIGGGDFQLAPVTVCTYDSAFLRAEQLGDKFLLLIFDEVHHLPAPSYRQIAEMFIAPYRMGLTATYRRDDGGHYELPRLIGGIVYELGVDDLAGKHLSPYTHEKILVALTPDEQRRYQAAYRVFTAYLQRHGLVFRGAADFRTFILRTGVDPAARKALLARNRALPLVMNSESKLAVVGDLLTHHRDAQTLIFTRYNRLVHAISRRFLIPAITHTTPRRERREILERFKRGAYRAIVTSQVLDEGVDVPDASIGLILSGTGSSREYVQRLGRILRKRPGKHAKIIEIVARDTVETRISRRRHRQG